ncbi:MAG: hypothetical protein ACRC76_04035 [Proteocatella sp.]
MSAFIGPIHSWLYNKIIFQDSLTDIILKVSENKGYELRNIIDDLYGELEKDELENIIDKSNIHGWLQERVNLVEVRLAYAVTKLIEFDEKNIELVLENVKAFGSANADTSKKSAEEIYLYLEEILLNGMPCDRVNNIESKSKNEVIWRQNIDIHEKYWIQLGGNILYYYEIRDSFIEGLLSDLDFEFIKLEDMVYSIRRV